ncbi:MAG: hypothetical protein ACI959_001401 [Limisphaerales bacterium]|jgi:hypothetical protein
MKTTAVLLLFIAAFSGLSAQVPYEVSVADGTLDTVYQLDPGFLVEDPFLKVASEDSNIQTVRTFTRDDRNSTRVFLILSAMLILLAFIRTQFEKNLRDLWGALINLNIAQQFHRENELSYTMQNFLLQLLFMMAFGLWITLALARLGKPIIGVNEWASFGIALLVIVIIFLTREIIRQFIARVFKLEALFSFFSFHIYILNGIAGIVLIPLLFLLAFSDSTYSELAFYASLGVLFILFLWRSIKGMQLGLENTGNSRLHFILYICTLEIAPIMVGFRFISDWLTVA